MSSRRRQLHLGLFLRGTGHHVASWRHPDVEPFSNMRFDHYRRIAQAAERAKFDTVFLADSIALRNGENPEAASRTGHTVHFEPLTLLSALAVTTSKIGLTATVSTSYNEPYNVARKFASLDHLSSGRAGWNVVTSSNQAEAWNFNRDSHFDHADRYARAGEFLDVTKSLWDSWDDDAFVADKVSGRYFDPEKVHVANHKGRYFQVRGPLNVARPVQGRPVIFQAGASEAGQELAAATAEAIFAAHQTLEEAQGFHASVKGRLAAYGREPDELKILPGIFPVVAATRQEARDKFEILQELVDPAVGLAQLSSLLGGADLSGLPLDGPLPDIADSNAGKSRLKLLNDLAGRGGLSIRETYLSIAGARGHWQVVGTPEDIADCLEEWFTEGGADGFNVMPPHLPGGFDDFAELVVPILQRRGLFRTEYEGSTLREHLGLRRPEVRATRPEKAVPA
jgi:FMN-dependent oxidoreductase (nitrilotriacetate monooxygenase family)